MGAVMDDLGSSIRLEAALPGGDEGSVIYDFAGGVDLADVSEELTGDSKIGLIGHMTINADYCGKCKENMCLLVDI